jgi:hypothetical protein
MPKRIQRQRVKGWRRGDAVIVDRTSRWGNPWRVGEEGVPDRAAATQAFALGLATRRIVLATAVSPAAALAAHRLGSYPTDEEIRAELAGKDLACPCPMPELGEPDYCHAAWLIYEASKAVPHG